MLIASKIHRPTAPIVLGNDTATARTYFFVPIDPQNPHSEHVCEVTDDDDIATLLAIKEGYCLAKSRPVPARPVIPPAPPPPGPETTPDTLPETVLPVTVVGEGAPDGTDSNETTDDAEAKEAAMKLHGLSGNALKAEIKKGGLPALVLQATLDIELAKPEDDQRETIIKLLQEAIASQGA